MLRVSLRGLRAHLGRLALSGSGIVLAVGFVVGTFVLTDTLDAAFDRLFALANRGIDVIVRAETAFTAAGPGTTFGAARRVPARLLRTVRGVEGVEAAEGFVMGYAQIVTPEGEAVLPQGPPTLGVSWMSDRFTSLVLRAGRRPSGPEEVAVDARTAREHDLRVGERITVISVRGPRRFRLVGIAGFGAADDLGGSTLAAFDPRTARRFLGAGRRVDEIDVIGRPGLAPAELRDRLARALPPRYEIATATRVAEEQSRAVREALGFLNTALLVFAGVAVFVAAFIIHDTFSILVAQRTRELGLLRAVGASPSQVAASVLAEAVAVGAVASLGGVGAGVLMARGLRGLLEAFGIALPAVGLRLAPRTVGIALAVGVAVTAASALAPALRAGRV
ncbi:MAG TPA: FtsX-like permease family protein, partial [Actinomycetota bacterium]|nr:FtsX-like permease family protein [Actinomycetota bacterium]